VKGKRRAAGGWLRRLAAALLSAAVLLSVPVGKPATAEEAGVQVLLDGEPLGEEQTIGSDEDDLRIYITLNGEELLVLPFAEAHAVSIVQPDGSVNTVTMTGEAVMMTEANCEGQDCVMMGEVTRENLEERVLGGFIICLPHRIAIEVR